MNLKTDNEYYVTYIAEYEGMVHMNPINNDELFILHNINEIQVYIGNINPRVSKNLQIKEHYAWLCEELNKNPYIAYAYKILYRFTDNFYHITISQTTRGSPTSVSNVDGEHLFNKTFEEIATGKTGLEDSFQNPFAIEVYIQIEPPPPGVELATVFDEEKSIISCSIL